jgi:hypothetical protein
VTVVLYVLAGWSLLMNVILGGLVVSERIGRERLIRYVVADTPAEVALLERATKRHPNEKAVQKVTVTDPLEMP